jgi:hypothetical protein
VVRPTAEAQVAFLQNVQRLLAEGSFTATYKFALLLALADLAVERGEDSDASLTLSTRDIAEAMIRLYWRQAMPYPAADAGVLRQNTKGQAEIVRSIARAREGAEGSLAALASRPADWERLVRFVDRTVREMPPWRLQLVGDERLDFLYPHDPGATQVTLHSGAAYSLRAFHGLIGELVRGAWLRFVRRRNATAIGEAADLAGFLFGTERAGLGRLQPLLRDIQAGACFYCRRSLAGPGEVDHFIAWSRYPVDLGHNFVLAHSACNRAKARYLAAIPHLAAWAERNALHGDMMAAELRRLDVDQDGAASARIAAWAYGLAESVGGQVWVHGRTLEPLTSAWRNALVGM